MYLEAHSLDRDTDLWEYVLLLTFFYYVMSSCPSRLELKCRSPILLSSTYRFFFFPGDLGSSSGSVPESESYIKSQNFGGISFQLVMQNTDFSSEI